MASVIMTTGWRNSAAIALNSVEEMRNAFRTIREQHLGRNVLVRLENGCGDELMVGLGEGLGVATLTPKSRGAVFNALGDAEFVRRKARVGFEWGNHWFEMGPENLLPAEVAERIAERWFVSGTRDDSVTWETCEARDRRGSMASHRP